MRKNYKLGTIVAVTWEDITGIDGWRSVDKAAGEKAVIAVSLGAIISYDKNYLRMAATWMTGEEKDVTDVAVIPTSVIREIKELTYK